jgi:hypothetical protein
MPTNLEQARSAVASEIGADAAEFTAPGERHFVAEAALMSMAGSFLFSFFKGVAKKAGDVAQEKVGDALGNAIGDAFGSLLNRLRGKAPQVTDQELQSAQAEAADAVKKQGLSQAEIDAIGQAVAQAMSTVLAKQADADVSSRVAERVKVEGLKTISTGV